MRLATADEMRAMDRRAIDEFGIPGIVLMENAALRVVDVLEREFSPIAQKRFVVLCGKGNNGGDGLAVARHLHTRFSVPVSVWLTVDPGNLTGDAASNYTMAARSGVSITTVTGDVPTGLAGELASPCVVIDALFGTGFHGKASGPAAVMIDAANASGNPIVAVDVPSGVNADSGAAEGAAIHASITVTFALGKPGLYVYPGVDCAGRVVVGDIAFPRSIYQGGTFFLTTPEDISGWLPSRKASRDANKGKFGHVSVFAGSAGFLGAANLAAVGAARSGAGLVTLCVPAGLLDAAMAMTNYVIMTSPLPQTKERAFSSAALDKALETAGKGTAAAIGPGIGRHDPETVRFACEFIRQCPVPLVIDADALTILSEQPGRGASIVKQREAATVLTPHPGEMARLLGKKSSEVQEDRLTAVREAAQSYGCVALLKGSSTLITDPGGEVWINRTGNTGMASGGMGDTLTGILAAFLGMKIPVLHATAAAAYLHGVAGDLAIRRNRGTGGLLATDVIETLPEAIAQCTGDAVQ